MVRVSALLLTVLTGFAGLVYEVAWQKYLATLLGSHSAATAVILALFLGGLAAGYQLFGVWTRRVGTRPNPPRLLVRYGCVEGGIGLFALAFPLLFDAVRALSLWLPVQASPLAFALDTALCAFLIIPPALGMGATIPVLTQALARNLEDATRVHALVYGLNTVGAFVGALAAGFWLVPTLGLVGTVVSMGVVNLIAGASYVALGWRPIEAAPAASESEPARPAVGYASLALVALLIGFGLMTVQTVLIRLGSLALGASQFTFSMVVAVFVLCIALGGLAVSLVRRIRPNALVANLWAVLVLLAVLYTVLDSAPYAAHVLRSLFRDHPAGFYPFQGVVFAALLVSLAPPLVLAGMALPLLFHVLRRELGGLGHVAGGLYAWNTLGSLLGALIGGYAALYVLDLHHVYRLALLALAAAAALVSVRIGGVGRVAGAGLLATTALAIGLLGPWSSERLSSGLFRLRRPAANTYLGAGDFYSRFEHEPLAFYDDDPVTSVAVKQTRLPDGRLDASVFTNGKSDGSLLHDYTTMALTALLPALLADDVERAFVIGWGMGVSAGELAALESTREVIVAEISPAVVRAAPLFAHGNLDAANNPKVTIEIADAYRALLRSGGTYDVIVSEPSNPWVQGVEMLYSREFLEAARDRLAPGGVHAQWMHAYENDAATLALTLRTYLAVFDQVSVWYGEGVDFLLLGRAAPAPVDLDRIASRAARADYAAGLERAGIDSLPALLAHELLPAGVLRELELEGELHTLLHPRLSYGAARAFFAGKGARLPPSSRDSAAALGAANSLVQRYVSMRGGKLDDEEFTLLTRETCEHRPRECATLLAWWAHEIPNSPNRPAVEHSVRLHPYLGKTTRLDRVADLSRLYEPEPSALDAPPLAVAMRTTDLFYDHYHHAAPFPREHLDSVWRQCASTPEQAALCARARAQAERHLGPLAPPTASNLAAQ